MIKDLGMSVYFDNLIDKKQAIRRLRYETKPDTVPAYTNGS